MDPSFSADQAGLQQALEALCSPPDGEASPLPDGLPETGLGEQAVLDLLGPHVLGGARRLGAETAFAHMDPPTPWISWAMTLWNASLNQNLLHPDLSPVAIVLEKRLIDWLAPVFGMTGGHMTAGSTLANLTALWAAREVKGVKRVIAADGAHLSAGKAAHILGLDFMKVGTDAAGAMDPAALPDDLSDTALVLTAGTTSVGAIDPLTLCGKAAWTHVDAAWAGPLMMSERYKDRLAGMEAADSVAISAHKWLFQPKESGIILFKEVEAAHQAVSFGGAYLAVPNVGVLGSHGAVAVPLMATLLAWGREGVAARVDHTMALADDLYRRLEAHPKARMFGPNQTGVLLWAPDGVSELDDLYTLLPPGATSTTVVGGEHWFRQVAANPNADMDQLWPFIETVLERA